MSKNIIPCKFGKSCVKNPCFYDHPFRSKVQIKCQLDPNCRIKNCIFSHSDPQPKPCKFGDECFTKDCTFTHDRDLIAKCPLDKSCSDEHCTLRHVKNSTKCRYGIKCFKKNCTFIHPPPVKKPCQFGDECFTKKCIYKHPRDSTDTQIQPIHHQNLQNYPILTDPGLEQPIIHCVTVDCDHTTCGLNVGKVQCEFANACGDSQCTKNHGIRGNYRKLMMYSCDRSSCCCDKYHHPPLIEAIVARLYNNQLTNFQKALLQIHDHYKNQIGAQL